MINTLICLLALMLAPVNKPKFSIVNDLKMSKDFIFIIEFLDSNDDNNNIPFYGYQYSQQKSPYGFPNPNPYGGFAPHGAFGNLAPHGFGFGH